MACPCLSFLITATHTFKDKKNSDIVLIPQPSDNPNDPLNWSVWKKSFAFSAVVAYTFISTWMGVGIATAITELSKDFGKDLNTTVIGVATWYIFTIAIGVTPPMTLTQNAFWSPTALYIGRRPVFLIVSIVSFAAILWCALATTFEMLVAARVLAAFVCAAAEALSAGICADLFFLHERGWWMGVWTIGITSSSSLGGIMSGFIIQGLGWRWHFWVSFQLSCLQDRLELYFRE
jgi:MFS family permease